MDQARSAIYRQLRFGRLLKTNKILEDVQLILNRITFTIDYQYLCDVDVVIENVTEDYYIKKNVYSDIDLICQSNCIFMVNTSCISITEIASLTRRKDKVIGVHFMNPVPMKTVVECIKGYHTSDETIQATKTLLLRLQKECLLVNDYPGFVSNRISHLFMNEAAFVIQDQVADPQTVDAIFKGAFSHKMGPLETADLIGIDIEFKYEVKKATENSYPVVTIFSETDVKENTGFLKDTFEKVLIQDFGAMLCEVYEFDQDLIDAYVAVGDWDGVNNVPQTFISCYLELFLDARIFLKSGGSNGLHILSGKFDFETGEWNI